MFTDERASCALEVLRGIDGSIVAGVHPIHDAECVKASDSGQGRCGGGGGGGGVGVGVGVGVKYRMLHIPGILERTYHLHVSVSVCSRF